MPASTTHSTPFHRATVDAFPSMLHVTYSDDDDNTTDVVGRNYYITHNEQTCQVCNHLYNTEERPATDYLRLIEMGDGTIVNACTNCRSNMYQCNDCSRFFWGHSNCEYYHLLGGRYCDDCITSGNYIRCENCGRLEHGDRIEEWHNSAYCHRCWNNMTTCENCGDFMYPDDSHHCSLCDENFCPDCYDNHHHSEFTEREPSDFIYGDTSAAKLLKFDRFSAVELEAEEGDSGEIDEDLPSGVGVCKDGSLDDTGIEIQTQPSTGDFLEDTIKKVCKVLSSRGYKATEHCGLHIHIDCRQIADDCQKLKQLFWTYWTVEPALYSILPSTRANNHYCYPLWKDYNKREFERFKKTSSIEFHWYKDNPDEHKCNKYDGTRYHGFNLHSVFYRGSLELRYHSATINPQKIINWLYINLKIVEWAINNFDKSVLDGLEDMTPHQRITRLCTVVGINQTVKNYMLNRMKLFNKPTL